jgi:hypothetical protein
MSHNHPPPPSSFFAPTPPSPHLLPSRDTHVRHVSEKLGSPLRAACLGGRLAMVRWLVGECGLDPCSLAPDGLAPLHVACVASR